MAGKKGNEYSLKEAIDEMLKTFRLDTKLDETRLVNAWAEVVGPVINKYTTSVKVSNKVLVVQLSSATVKQELMYRKSELVAALNKAAGGEIIQDISLR